MFYFTILFLSSGARMERYYQKEGISIVILKISFMSHLLFTKFAGINLRYL